LCTRTQVVAYTALQNIEEIMTALRPSTLRTIKRLHQAISDPIDDLSTHRPLPSRTLSQLDPFLFLNHHGPQIYPKNNGGLPFGPHPHRGFETVTFILDGDLQHQDSGGYTSVIEKDGVQWMRAGSGLIHNESSSPKFLKNGGNFECLQLWVNLRAKDKMTAPVYKGLQDPEIPKVTVDDGKAVIHVCSGKWGGVEGPFDSISGIRMAWVVFKNGGKIEETIPEDHTIFFYVARGKFRVNGSEAAYRQLVEFNYEGELLQVEALQDDSILLIGHCLPFKEPVVSYGPFVMNTQREIVEAQRDYQLGKFGKWTH